jgi:hypothetical protein
MKIRSEFLQLLHLDGRTERKKEQKIIYLVFIPELTQTLTQLMYLLPIAVHRDSACYVQRLTAHHIYCTNTVQTVQSATELYLQ